MPSTIRSLFALAAFLALQAPAFAVPAPFQVGDKVLAQGSFHRHCAAEVAELADPAHARLAFEQKGCGDAEKLYSLKSLQHLSPAEKAVVRGKEIRPGDSVLAPGYFSATCSGKVRAISRGGYVTVDFDSLLCADSAALRKASELRKVDFVEEAEGKSQTFRLGQEVVTQGIHQDEKCQGRITRLTDNGFAQLSFKSPACAYGGKLYSLDQLSLYRSPASRPRVTGEAIFQRVMREIASSRSGRKNKL